MVQSNTASFYSIATHFKVNHHQVVNTIFKKKVKTVM
jgi:hypothetical protein